MDDLVQRFWGFEKLIGPLLVKIMYYFGFGVIVLATLWAMAQTFSDFRFNALSALARLFVTPIVGALVIVFWRFICEMSILAFSVYERLGEIRDRLGAAPPPAPTPPNYGPPAPNHPQF
ncbi:MAG: DUF4282 domain-containing protein [Alphaproteobacteria bacterium]|nr:DUF4282 domain-containing protein [Alphaproteobacteria bacterium]